MLCLRCGPASREPPSRERFFLAEEPGRLPITGVKPAGVATVVVPAPVDVVVLVTVAEFVIVTVGILSVTVLVDVVVAVKVS